MRLLAPGAPLDPARLADVASDEWSAIAARFVEHRVAPLAHWCAQQRGDLNCIPEPVATEWLAERQAHTLRSLHLQRQLTRIARLFDDAGHEWVALKGAHLAFFAYPEPALRPMRDLDFAFRSTHAAVDGWNALRTLGFSLLHPFDGDPIALLAERHQLPTLISPDEEVAVEIQHRLFHHGTRDPAFEPHFWSDVVEEQLLDTRLRLCGADWLALHITVHGVRDHRFDSGPNVVADIAMLARAGQLATDRVAALARTWEAREEWALLERLREVQWNPDAAPEQTTDIRDAWTLMLAPPDDVVAARRRSRRRVAGRRGMAAKLFPSRQLLEGRYGKTGLMGLLGHFVRHHLHMAFNRLPALAVDRSAPAVEKAMQRLDARLQRMTDDHSADREENRH